MSADTGIQPKSKFGTLGLDVGVLGRWSRLISGLLILIPLVVNVGLSFSPSVSSIRFYGLFLVYFIAILVVYSLAYRFLGERFLARVNPWVTTVIFVGPAILVDWWNLLVAPFTNLGLPQPLVLAMTVYIAISLILQWRIKYGGCEVVSIPILLFRRRYPSYCIPLVVIDAVEKVVVDTKAKSTQKEEMKGAS